MYLFFAMTISLYTDCNDNHDFFGPPANYYNVHVYVVDRHTGAFIKDVLVGEKKNGLPDNMAILVDSVPNGFLEDIWSCKTHKTLVPEYNPDDIECTIQYSSRSGKIQPAYDRMFAWKEGYHLWHYDPARDRVFDSTNTGATLFIRLVEK